MEEDFNSELKLTGKDWQIPKDIREWLGHLLLLYGVPFNYLVPEEDMLPPESIRFFYLYPGWMKCLLEGACSVGRSSTVDERLDQRLRNNFLTKAAEVAGEVRLKAKEKIEGKKRKLNWPLTGFLIRSQVVEGWQGLEMKASGVDAQGNIIVRLEPLRIDRLNPETMLCIFNGKIKKIEVKQPPEGMHFGASPAGENKYKKLHLRRLYLSEEAGPSKEAGDQIEIDHSGLPVPMREDIQRVVDIKSLADNLADNLADKLDKMEKPMKSVLNDNNAIDGKNNGRFTSAEFGVQMVESPGRVTFSDNTFTGIDIINLSSFAALLKERTDRVLVFLWGKLSKGVQKRLSAFGSTDQEHKEHQTQLDALVKKLNEIMQNESIYKEERFADVVLSDETQKLLEEQPRSEALVRINRLLLEGAYPDTIVKSKDPDFSFSAQDSKDLESLVGRLKNPSDSLSYFLLSRLRGVAPQLFSSLEEDLTAELNRIIRGELIYEKKLFTGVALSEETKELLEKKPWGEELVRLNRLLLEDAYPNEIARRPN